MNRLFRSGNRHRQLGTVIRRLRMRLTEIILLTEAMKGARLSIRLVANLCSYNELFPLGCIGNSPL
jgi:hypothetical protein